MSEHATTKLQRYGYYEMGLRLAIKLAKDGAPGPHGEPPNFEWAQWAEELLNAASKAPYQDVVHGTTEKVLRATAAFCRDQLRILEINAEVDEAPLCDNMLMFTPPSQEDFEAECLERMWISEGPETGARRVMWYELSSQQVDGLCERCRRRVALWTERRALRRAKGVRLQRLYRTFRDHLAAHESDRRA